MCSGAHNPRGNTSLTVLSTVVHADCSNWNRVEDGNLTLRNDQWSKHLEPECGEVNNLSPYAQMGGAATCKLTR